MSVRIEWDERAKLLAVRRGRLLAPIWIGPNGLDGALRVERNRLRRVALEQRALGARPEVVLLAQLRDGDRIEERVVAEFPASALSNADREALLARLAALDLRPVIRVEQGPSREVDQENVLSGEEAAYLNGAKLLPDGCAYVRAGQWTPFATITALVVAFMGLGFMVAAAVGGLHVGAVAPLIALGAYPFVLISGGALLARVNGRERADAIFLLPDHLLVRSKKRLFRIPPERFLGAVLKELPSGYRSLFLREKRGAAEVEVDLCDLVPGGFPPSRWEAVLDACERWRAGSSAADAERSEGAPTSQRNSGD